MAGQEVKLAEDEFIVSKTDPKGKITYANRVFMEIAGYCEAELLAQPHNMIRHPDMPRGTFYLLWKTLQSGQEFFGYVKNQCANQSYYWVFANVSPDYDSNGHLKGYYSVRRKPAKGAIETVEPIYREMLQIEAQHSGSRAPETSVAWLTETLRGQGTNYEDFILTLQG